MDLLATWLSYWNSHLADGFVVTVTTTVIGTFLVVFWALVIVAARISKLRPVRFIGIAYVEVFRGTPILVQLFTLYFALPILVNLYLPLGPTVILALVLNTGGYLAESYRSGLQAIPRGQIEAASALGMSRWLVLRRVTAPIGLRLILPAIGNMTVAILLTSPIASTIGAPDLLYQAGVVRNDTQDFSVFIFATIIYVVLALLLAWGNRRLERRLRLP